MLFESFEAGLVFGLSRAVILVTHGPGPWRGCAKAAASSMSRTQRAAIVDDINAGIQAGQCACDLRNPQGSCCLGNVREAIKQLDSA